MSSAITLNFPKRVRIAGEQLTGTVDINVLNAQEEDIEHVKIKFRGAVQTYTERSSGQSTSTYRANIPLIREDIPLWTRGQAFPAPGSHVLTFPFKFQLPTDLPPSFHAQRVSKRANVTYFIEVVGAREGILHLNRRVRAVIAVIPAGWPMYVQLRQALMDGPPDGSNIGWKTHTLSDSIRTGIWGEYSQVTANLRLPDIPAFPFGTPIRVHLDVTTVTKPLKPSDVPDEGDDKPLFPAPPIDPSSVTLRVDMTAKMKSGLSRTITDTIIDHGGPIGGFGLPGPYGPHVRYWQEKPIWTTTTLEPKRKKLFGREKEGEERRICTRTTHFETIIDLKCSPSFQTDIITTSHTLHLCVPFPGIGNDLKCDIPISIVSGVPPPSIPSPANVPRPDTREPDRPTEDEDRHDSPPDFETALTMDLPPAYWTAEHHDFGADDKS
ncbi:hypothetical protein PUNSTDRAFT_54683 [Punctularia strigosozonata HHB-11173 SS5]|uniref:uncharacterized protein n=1 Tax=Punctularia strigosozonata (strain HHB-11173) TaxID=741275 RepID=UPI0004416FBE|nr:uncharacterized protein PUNSTDRAFT_54683 [Punctularia strigosozonata HHB-11173 SS5]EIN05819.1 hypothetical protein PUNSTDRAFT_54683 [Punctularia strigosozonata HHB-11173 SS5]